MNKKILLIEDNKEVRENIAEILELSKYQVFTAQNGKEGVELARKNKPDLIICDIMMPVLDGYGVLHLLSKNTDTASIPFIFLTAKADKNDFRKGMGMGADDYITKPFDDTDLLNAIESRLKKSETLKSEFSKNVDGLNAFIKNAKGIEDLKKLPEKYSTKKYKKKESIYSSEEYPKGVFFVQTGKVKTYKMHEQGKELITGLYKEGEFFGYLALLEEQPYTDSATALEDAEVCLISKDDFFSLIYNNSEVSRRFIKMLSDNLHDKEEQLIKLAYNSVRKRIAEALVVLYGRYKKKEENTFSINISREDLASLVGTATETTIRTLSDFRDEGLVDVKGGTIAIKNYDKLLKMKN